MTESNNDKIVDQVMREYGLNAKDFGNSARFAAAVLHKHWKLDHSGVSGGTDRPIACMVCRGLMYRYSQARRDETKQDPLMWNLEYQTLTREIKGVAEGLLASAKQNKDHLPPTDDQTGQQQQRQQRRQSPGPKSR